MDSKIVIYIFIKEFAYKSLILINVDFYVIFTDYFVIQII